MVEKREFDVSTNRVLVYSYMSMSVPPAYEPIMILFQSATPMRIPAGWSNWDFCCIP